MALSWLKFVSHLTNKWLFSTVSSLLSSTYVGRKYCQGLNLICCLCVLKNILFLGKNINRTSLLALLNGTRKSATFMPTRVPFKSLSAKKSNLIFVVRMKISYGERPSFFLSFCLSFFLLVFPFFPVFFPLCLSFLSFLFLSLLFVAHSFFLLVSVINAYSFYFMPSGTILKVVQKSPIYIFVMK